MELMRKFFAYWVLLLLSLDKQAASYPTRAGSCSGGKPAVGGSHVSYGDGARHVLSGNLLDSHLQLFFDGIELTKDGADVTVKVGVDHVVEIVANSRPFKGALLRFESSVPMTVEPMINAGEESECGSLAQVEGVSHVDSTPKNAFSAGLTVYTEGVIALDVTVVEYNNSTGSVFWYSHFKLSSGEFVNHPDSFVNTDRCFVCGDEEMFISNSNQVVLLSGLALTCDELFSLGKRAEIPSEKCEEATALAKSSCGCRRPLPTPSPAISTPFPTFAEKCYVCGSKDDVVGTPNEELFFENKIWTCDDLYHDGLKGLISPFDCGRAQSTASQSCLCEARSSPTYEPTVTPLPTYSEPCFVCGDTNRYTTSDDIVQVDDIAVSCFDLMQDGITGFIPPDLCPTAQQVAMENCGCSSTSTMAPTMTMTPTATPYPTFANKCFVCGTGYEVSLPDEVIEIDGVKGTCRSLEEEGLSGYIPFDVCSKAQVVAQVSCGCLQAADQAQNTPCLLCETEPWTITNLDTEIEVSGDKGTCEELDSVVRSNLLADEFCAEAQTVARSHCGCTQADSAATFEPTITPAPTITASPTYSEPCFVCSQGHQITEKSTLVTVDGLLITCEELEAAGRDRLIPPKFCIDAQEQASLLCKCSAVPSPGLTTLPPTSTPFPTVTYTPTFSSFCNLCTLGEFVTKRDALVTLENLLLSCEELEEAASERMIPPSLCPLAQAQAQSLCGCKKPATLDGDSPALSPVRTLQPSVTFQPTITATPTYKVGCSVCGSSSKRVFDPNKVVRVADILLTCRDLEEAGREASIPPTICPEAQSVAHTECMCGAEAMTFRPTISPAPTVTPAPSHHRHCSVCSPGWSVSNRAAVVVMSGYAITCEELESIGTTGHLPPDLCFEAKQQAKSSCMCLPDTFDEGQIEIGAISFGSSGQRRGATTLIGLSTSASLALLFLAK